jgi:hypothetical protein
MIRDFTETADRAAPADHRTSIGQSRRRLPITFMEIAAD